MEIVTTKNMFCFEILCDELILFIIRKLGGDYAVFRKINKRFDKLFDEILCDDNAFAIFVYNNTLIEPIHKLIHVNESTIVAVSNKYIILRDVDDNIYCYGQNGYNYGVIDHHIYGDPIDCVFITSRYVVLTFSRRSSNTYAYYDIHNLNMIPLIISEYETNDYYDGLVQFYNGIIIMGNIDNFCVYYPGYGYITYCKDHSNYSSVSIKLDELRIYLNDCENKSDICPICFNDYDEIVRFVDHTPCDYLKFNPMYSGSSRKRSQQPSSSWAGAASLRSSEANTMNDMTIAVTDDYLWFIRKDESSDDILVNDKMVITIKSL